MSNLSESNIIQLKQAGFTDREISLYRQKFYNLLNTMPAPLVTKELAACPQCGYRKVDV